MCDVVRTGELRLFGSPAEMVSRYPATDRGGPTPYRAWAVFPLRAAGMFVGAVSLSFPQQRDFAQGERALLEAMSSQASLALERCRLFEGEREARAEAEVAAEKVRQALEVARTAMDRLRVLARVSRAITEEPLDVPSVCGAVARHVAEELGDGCGVYLLVQGSDAIETVAMHDVKSDALEALKFISGAHPVRLDDGLIGRVMRTGVSMLIPVVDHQRLLGSVMAEYRDYVCRFPVRSLVVAPIRHAGKVLGALALVRRDSPRPYELADVELLEDLGGRAALAVTRARERQELEDARRKAQEANRAKDEFLAMLGHELRNPLAPILTALRADAAARPGAGGQGAGDDRAAGAAPGPAGRRPAGRVAHHPAARSSCARARSSWRGGGQGDRDGQPAARAARAPADHRRCRAAGCWSRPTRSGWRRWSRNLLTNAAKYTEPGGHIAVRAPARRATRRCCGCGTTASASPRSCCRSIFELFVQGRQRHRSRPRAGWGWG